MKKNVVTVVLLSLLFYACAPTVAQRTGVRYDALPEDCPIEFINSTSGVNMGDYEILGNTTLTGAESFTDEIKEELRPTVCKWGGDAVSIMASSSAMGVEGATFQIMRKKDVAGDSTPGSLACYGKYTNSSGANLVFNEDNTVSMEFAGNTASCTSQTSGGSEVAITCGGMATSGNFASDCSSVTYNGMTLTKQ